MRRYGTLEAILICLMSLAGEVANSAEPLLASTYIGGTNKDGSLETPVVVDAQGNIFVAGRTRSTNFPVIAGSYDTDGHNGMEDVFIAKFSPDLKHLLASTYFGGSGYEGIWPGVAMAIDRDGNIYVAGRTTSGDLPHTYDSLRGYSDAFIAKFDNNLQNLIACRFLGGSSNEYYLQLAIDASGDVFVSGSTSSGDFPTTPGAFRGYFSGGGDGPYPGDLFVCRFTSDLSTLLASTYVGGSSYEYCEQLIVGSSGDVYLSGWVGSTNFPRSPGAYDTTYGGGGFDAFVTILSHDLSTLVASTYLGDTGWDFIYGMTVDQDGNVYVTGHTQSINFPTTPGAWDRIYSGSTGDTDDAFITKFNPSLSSLLASTYLGGVGWDIGSYLALTSTGHILIAGNTGTPDFPNVTFGFDPTYNWGYDDFVALMDNGLTTVKTASYLGGETRETPTALILLQSGDICIGSITNSQFFPTTAGSYDPIFNGSGSAWDDNDNWGGDVAVTIMPASGFSDADPDGDGIPSFMDNCPAAPNPDQSDVDGDYFGDVCDVCPVDSQNDLDQDGVCEVDDNCYFIYNPDQADADDDGIGDLCDDCTDTDGDYYGDPGFPASTCLVDNCPLVYNPGQEDSDGDGLGDACDGCCSGRVGDANGLGTYPQEVTISDVQTLVTAKFVTGTCASLPCLAEADANQSGGANPTCNDISIGDIQTLVNHLFIACPANAPLKNCL